MTARWTGERKQGAIGLFICCAFVVFALGPLKQRGEPESPCPGAPPSSLEGTIPGDLLSLSVLRSPVPATDRAADAHRERPDRAGSAEVRGELLSQGLPLRNAELDLVVQARGRTRTLSTTSDGSGAFLLYVETPCTIVRFVVHETSLTPRRSIVRRDDVRSGDEIEVRLEVQRWGELRGTVTDLVGAPVPDADVAWWAGGFDPEEAPSGSVKAGLDGSFAIGALGDDFYVVASKPGLACVHGLKGDLAVGETAAGLSVQMMPSAQLRGRVVGPTGMGIAGARVSVDATTVSGSDLATGHRRIMRFYPVKASVLSSPDGTFELGPVPSWKWTATVAHEEYLPWRGLLSTDPAEVLLSAGSAVSGEVVDARGFPVQNARVTLRAPDGSARTLRTDTRGRFDCTGFPAGARIVALVHAAGHAIGSTEILAGIPDARIQLGDGHDLEGMVLHDGEPVSEAEVVLRGSRVVDLGDFTFDETPTLEWALGINSTVTDAAGHFVFRDLYPGTFSVRLTSAGGTTVFEDILLPRPDEGPLVLQLGGKGAWGLELHGSVTDAATGSPLPGVSASLACGVSGEDTLVSVPGDVRMDEPGHYRLSIPSRDVRFVTLWTDGYLPATIELDGLATGIHERDVTLGRARTLSYRLIAEHDGPFNIRVLDGSGQPLVFEPARGYRTNRHRSRDAKGVLHGLPAEPLVLTVDTDNGAVDSSFPIDLRSADSGETLFFLEARSPTTREIVILGARRAGEVRPEADGGTMMEGGAWRWIDEPVDVELTTASGETLSVRVDSLGPEAGYEITYSGTLAGSRIMTLPLISLPADLRVRRIRASASSYRDRVLTLDPGESPPPFVLLERE
jgi:uncharacterized GH25 family protein